jgi:alpha-tubulin suppressor-like RCC1 family protein
LNFPGQPPPKMIKIYVGNYHSVAISDDGKYVMTWGRGELGQLGHQYSKSTSVPTVVKHLVGSEKHRSQLTYAPPPTHDFI